MHEHMEHWLIDPKIGSKDKEYKVNQFFSDLYKFFLPNELFENGDFKKKRDEDPSCYLAAVTALSKPPVLTVANLEYFWKVDESCNVK